MIVKKSKDIAGIRYIERNIVQDKKGHKYLNYNYPTMLSGGISDVFESIFQKRIEQENEFHGLFYYPGQAFLFRCIRGSARLYAVDLREASRSYRKCVKPVLKTGSGIQAYLPAGFAWGILSTEEDTVIQIHATKGTSEVPIMIDAFDSSLKMGWQDEDIIIAEYDLPLVIADSLRKE